MKKFRVFSLVLALILVFGAVGVTASAEEKIRIVEWNWNEVMCNHMTDIYAEAFPEVEYEYVIVNANDYMQKLQAAIASGSEVPDIILGESAWRGSLYALDILDNLEAEPYNLDRSEFIEKVIPLLSNSEGQIVGFDQQFACAGLAYRRDLTEKYFGVSEPDEVAALIADWDKFTQAGQKLAEQTGDVYMMASITDLMDVIRAQNAAEYIDGDTIDITGRFTSTLELATQIRDAGVPLGQYEKGTNAWNATFAEGNVIFYVMPSWGSKTYVATNYPESDGQGLWGLCTAPGNIGFTNGGTVVGIYKNSPNKEKAYEMLHYLYCSVEGAGQMFERMGYLYSFNDFYTEESPLFTEGGFYDSYYADQNIGLYMYENIAPTIVTESMTEYTSIVNSAFEAVKLMYLADPSMTAEAGIQSLKDMVVETNPELNVK